MSEGQSNSNISELHKRYEGLIPGFLLGVTYLKIAEWHDKERLFAKKEIGDTHEQGQVSLSGLRRYNLKRNYSFIPCLGSKIGNKIKSTREWNIKGFIHAS